MNTPFLMDPFLKDAIDPTLSNDGLEQLMQGTILENESLFNSLSDTEIVWIQALKQVLSNEIALTLSIEDFKHFFRSKQERTASSPFGRRFGHYESLLECIRRDQLMLPQLIIDIAYISLVTASPLTCWQIPKLC